MDQSKCLCYVTDGISDRFGIVIVRRLQCFLYFNKYTAERSPFKYIAHTSRADCKSKFSKLANLVMET